MERRLNAGLREMIGFVEEEFACLLGKGVGHAVAVIWFRRLADGEGKLWAPAFECSEFPGLRECPVALDG